MLACISINTIINNIKISYKYTNLNNNMWRIVKYTSLKFK